MASLPVDTLNFTFSAAIANAQLYDQWIHYTTVFNAPPGGKKAIDVVAVEAGVAPATTWMIEAKDFRVITNPPKSSNIGGLAQLVADKVQDSIAGLTDAAASATTPSEKSLAVLAISAPTKRVVLHLEPHVGAHSALFPAGFAASVLQRLRQLVRSIDPNPLVLNIANTPSASVPWTVS
ncbi:MAG: hypothetical protein RLZZ232_3886 [Planctomycetota bacterium]|jgi:hypothetical protein